MPNWDHTNNEPKKYADKPPSPVTISPVQNKFFEAP